MIPTPPQDKHFPYGRLIAGGLGACLPYRVVSDDLYTQILSTLSKGVGITIFVFPQAFRTIMPPLGNDFIALVKVPSLVSVLGVTDIAQLGKVTAAGNFRYFETCNVVALLYLIMTDISVAAAA